jgi:hypothetical protein
MSNMSYCRFENTYSDLVDCYEALGEQELDDLSETERKYAEKLIKLCEKISNNYGEDEDND